MDIRCEGIDLSYGRIGQMRITLSVAQSSADAVLAQIDKLADKDVDVKIVRHSEKRSLGANALMWKCLSGLAEALCTDGLSLTKDEMYLKMLEDYGHYDFYIVQLNAVDEAKRQFRICKEFGEISVGKGRGMQLQCWKGSSKYNVQQMTKLLNGVIEECKDAGAWVPDEDTVFESIDIWRAEYEKA